MESYSLRGKVYKVFDTVQVTEKFRKKEFIVEVNSSSGSGTFTDYIKFQAVQDNVDQAEFIHKGDLVVIRWALAGRKWGKGEDEKYFTNVEALDINIITHAEGNETDDSIEESLPLGEDKMSIWNNPEIIIPKVEEEPDDLPF